MAQACGALAWKRSYVAERTAGLPAFSTPSRYSVIPSGAGGAVTAAASPILAGGVRASFVSS